MPFGINMPNPYEREDEREDLREQTSPILDHIYSGPAWRMDTMGHEYEHITGAFRVIERSDLFAIVGNGEDPEGRWMIFDEALKWLEKA